MASQKKGAPHELWKRAPLTNFEKAFKKEVILKFVRGLQKEVIPIDNSIATIWSLEPGVNEFEDNKATINSVERARDNDDLQFRKGQLNIIASVLSLRDQVENLYEQKDLWF